MSRRDDGLISTREEALQWVDEFKHTITDAAVLKVVEQLASDPEPAFGEIGNPEDQLAEAADKLEHAIELAAKWAMEWVDEDHAPTTVEDYIRQRVGF